MTIQLYFVFSLIIIISFNFNWICWCLKLTGTRIPYYGVLHREGTLDCNFDLENDTLYAVKWYKDGHEFFRYKPSEDPPIKVFEVDGVFVNENRSSLHHVQLDQITMETQGDYKCEISAEAPSFQTLDEEKKMRIMVLPQKGPKINGIYPWYNVGDNFTASCNVNKSFPAAKLNWFVNDAQIDAQACGCVTFDTMDVPGKMLNEIKLFSSSTELKFPIDSTYFRDGSISIECRATFPRSLVNLQDIVVTNVKSGLGLQYAESLSGSNKHQLFLFNFISLLSIIIILLLDC